MAKKMLIDATHTEETRVVVVDGNKVEEFDFESENKRQLAGNIYLAKVSRVEPSLQAAFVEYGGNRHGFLAFSEIHPDYYQIPVADREALLAEDRAYAQAQAAEEDEKPKRSRRRRKPKSEKKAPEASAASTSEDSSIDGMEVVELDGDESAEHANDNIVADEPVQKPKRSRSRRKKSDGNAEATTEAAKEDTAEDTNGAKEDAPKGDNAPGSDDDNPKTVAMAVESDDPTIAEGEEEAEETDATSDDDKAEPPEPQADSDAADGVDGNADDDDGDKPLDPAERDEAIESVADEDVTEEIRQPRKSRPRRYKIQEVVKVRQIMLVQVVKEERGNKGAALTTYLSLAGRYCVLMPNTARGGGISRKITNAPDRKKLKEIANEIDVPDGAGLIIRTAGAKRTKSEIKRDYEYLQRLWEQIRELTLKSIAPAKIYEEGDLIKRSIRDLYSREIDEVHVEGEGGYRTAKDFMKMIMPSHAKNVKLYQDPMPLFARFQVESYLSSMFNPTVQLKSGGYIVIGVTEALVAIDVNSGRATKEGSIEETALKTNLEASEEVARQLRLRDLAGLIVIDFIDMEERRNNSAVEKRMKDKLKTDRARIQVGRISGFGLMEMSRQRLRPGMIEATTQPCPSCHGTGLVRSDDNLALTILRQLEEEGTRRKNREVLLKAPVGIVNFLVNQKREHIAQIEGRYGMAIRVEADPMLISPDFSIEKFKTATRLVQQSSPVVSVDASMMPDEEEVVEATPEAPQEEDAPKKRRRRRRRRRGGGGSGENSGAEAQSAESAETAQNADETPAEEAPAETPDNSADEAEKPKPRRRRSSRSKKSEVAEEPVADESKPDAEDAKPAETVDAAAEEKPKRKRVTRSRKKKEPEATATEAATETVAQPAPVPEAKPSPPAKEPVAAVEVAAAPAEAAKPKKRGWWSMGR